MTHLDILGPPFAVVQKPPASAKSVLSLCWRKGLMMGQLVIDLLPAKYVRSAVELLADAFRDDPIFCFHFPDPVCAEACWNSFSATWCGPICVSITSMPLSKATR